MQRGFGNTNDTCDIVNFYDGQLDRARGSEGPPGPALVLSDSSGPLGMSYVWEGCRVNMMFWVHCLVADGLIRVDRNENGERGTIPGPN